MTSRCFRAFTALVSFALVSLFFSATAHSSALDSGFGKRGIAGSAYGSTKTLFSPSALLRAPNRYILFGQQHNEIAMFGFNPDGSVDTSFGIEGRRYFDPIHGNGDDADQPADVIWQGKKLLAAGGIWRFDTMWNETEEQTLTRFDVDGNIDRSFGDRGSVRFPRLKPAIGAAVDSRGRILTISNHGSSGGGPVGNPYVPGRAFLTRLKPDGNPDRGFGKAGTLQRSVLRGSVFRTIAVDDADRLMITVIDHYRNEKGRKTARTRLMRLSRAGKVDKSYSGDGFSAEAPFRFWPVEALELPGGRIAVSGEGWGGNGPAMVFYDADGNLDASVGDGGVLRLKSSGTFKVQGRLSANLFYGLLDNRVVTVGLDGAVTRFKALPDRGWGAVTSDTDGSLITGSGGYETPVLGRVAPDGSVDDVFSLNGGPRRVMTEPAFHGFSSITELADRSLLAISQDDSPMEITRHRADGRGAFKFKGKVILPVKTPEFSDKPIVLPAGGNRFDLIGSGRGAATNFRMRVDRRGVRSTRLIEGFKRAHVSAGLRLGDGGIVLAGSTQVPVKGKAGSRNKTAFKLVKYRADGSIDDRFGRNGGVQASFRLGAAGETVTRDRRGRFLVAGGNCHPQHGCGSSKEVVQAPSFARFTAQGRPDRSFGRRGRIQIPYGRESSVLTTAVLKDGRIAALLDGACVRGCRNRIDLMVLKPNGRLDHRFGKGGKLELRGGNVLEAVRLFPAGRHGLDIAGTFEPCRKEPGFSVLRLNRRGALDRGFGGGDGVLHARGGRAIATFAQAAIRQKRGRITLSGYLERRGYFGGLVWNSAIGRIDLTQKDGKTPLGKCRDHK